MSENRDVTRPALDALEVLSALTGACFFYRIHCGQVTVRRGYMHLAPEGTPDIGGVVHGRAVYFETKTPRYKVTDVQAKIHERLRRAGALVYVPESARECIDIVSELLKLSPEGIRNLEATQGEQHGIKEEVSGHEVQEAVRRGPHLQRGRARRGSRKA